MPTLNEVLGIEIRKDIETRYRFLFALYSIFEQALEEDPTLEIKIENRFPKDFKRFYNMKNTEKISFAFILYLCNMLNIDFQEVKF